MPGPAATIGSIHTCPMFNPGVPPIPHVGGPVTGPGVPTVLIGGKPAAVVGDLCTCVGPPDTIAQGEATVLIGGKPAATVGSMTAHGGAITVGETTVLIGTGVSAPTAILPLQEIPFPKISPVLNVLASVTGRSLKEAKEKQDELKQEAKKNTITPEYIFSM
ncbi:paar repeat-containing protein [Aquimarina algicola]|uniref:Paar repeat-containing protein n=1 Tax=Aquimarina algicola TaxID=2589995 RepID=A0A504J5Q5_9FLAO|nr:paar repeat-containing protein [Aquimarina algicola]